MKQVYAGETVALSYTLAASTYEAKVRDAIGNYMQATVSQDSGTATVNVNAGRWTNGQAGMGHVEITDTSSGRDVVVSERIRIKGGSYAQYNGGVTAYGG